MPPSFQRNGLTVLVGQYPVSDHDGEWPMHIRPALSPALTAIDAGVAAICMQQIEERMCC